MKKVLGYSLFVVGFISILFFSHYNGVLISSSWLWYLISVAVYIASAFLLSSAYPTKQKTNSDKSRSALQDLKDNAEKLVVEFDNCTFKTNNYSEEMENENFSSVKMYDALYNPNQQIKTTDIDGTVIIYKLNTAILNEEFISQVFPMDLTTLRFYILSKNVTLYVDKSNRKNYFFDLVTE